MVSGSRDWAEADAGKSPLMSKAIATSWNGTRRIMEFRHLMRSDSRLFSSATPTWCGLAAGATVPIFLSIRRLQINPSDVGQRRQPCQNVGKLGRLFGLRTASQCTGQFTDLFHEPHERAVQSPAAILGAIRGFDVGLDLGKRQGHFGRISRG